MVAASSGADVTAMDLHRDVGSFIETNCTANDLTIRYLQADWRVYEPDRAYDYIFGSDISLRECASIRSLRFFAAGAQTKWRHGNHRRSVSLASP
jgi:predicted nicotinamide N-methyase